MKVSDDVFVVAEWGMRQNSHLEHQRSQDIGIIDCLGVLRRSNVLDDDLICQGELYAIPRRAVLVRV